MRRVILLVRFTVRVAGRYNVSGIHPDVICEKREFLVKFGGTAREILFTGEKESDWRPRGVKISIPESKF